MNESAQPALVAFDGSPEARAAVTAAAALFPARRLLIVSVWEPGLALAVEPSYDLTGSGPTLPSAEEISAVDHAQHGHATRTADEGVRLARELGATADPFPVPDEAHVAETLVAIAERNDAAVIVTGSRGLGRVKSRFMGSTSRDLLRHSERARAGRQVARVACTRVPHVFGYGSLPAAVEGTPSTLRDHRRGWAVAMDNRVTIPGYKYYLDEDGGRPDVYVAFLAIRPEPGATVDGVTFAVDEAALAELDARERNYDRVDVSGLVDPDPGGRVWAYAGSAAGRERLAAGRAAGTAVVAEQYVTLVAHAEPPDLPVRRLFRCDVAA